MSPGRVALTSTGIIILMGMGSCTYMFLSAPARLKGVCASIPNGTTFAELSNIAHDHGLNAPRAGASTTHIVETRTFGRFGCRVELEGGRVKSVAYVFAS